MKSVNVVFLLPKGEVLGRKATLVIKDYPHFSISDFKNTYIAKIKIYT